MNLRFTDGGDGLRRWAAAALAVALLLGCGSGSGDASDSGTDKTYLSVDAVDAEGDALHYQWRVTAGQIDNRDAKETVWTLPPGPGLHFAYVIVSDGKGGYAERQYAVSSDALETPVPDRAAVQQLVAPIDDPSSVTARLRFDAGDPAFVAGDPNTRRRVYLPDVQVEVWAIPAVGSPSRVYAGSSDLAGDISVPGLHPNVAHEIRCATTPGVAPIRVCGHLTTSANSSNIRLDLSPDPNLPPIAENLQLFGHIGLSDGSLCGVDNDYFGVQTAARVHLIQADGTPLSAPIRVNRFGDYAIRAAVPVLANLQLKVQCEGQSVTLAVPAAAGNTGYSSAIPVQLSHVLANSRPVLRRVVANGPDGNVRGREIVAEANAGSNLMPGSEHFLTLRGKDTRASACRYYRAIGVVADCDAQGRPTRAMTLDDWKRKNLLAPYGSGNTEWQATYINKMDLNLVRRMAATRSGNRIAFNVCNHPGPDGNSQKEIDQVMDVALNDQRMIACVAMEWSVVPGIAEPITQFLAFGPDGTLQPSVNLDGRGEKFLPGACVACHGSTRYAGRFPETGNPSPDLGARFLPFDTGNYLFPSRTDLNESAQSESIYQLNQLVRDTEFPLAPAPGFVTPTTQLIDRWYAGTGHRLNPAAALPAVWSGSPDHRRLYLEVVGSVCRTCHTAMGANLDWDAGAVGAPNLLVRSGSAHICGGGPDLAVNASMPNALVSRDRLNAALNADPSLSALMVRLLGCATPSADPVYPRR